jgi:hypothetical protein
MGLFNFFKTAEQKKKERLMHKLTSEIFSEGKQSFGKLMIAASIMNSKIILEEEPFKVNKGKLFEVLIFSCWHILKECHYLKPDKYQFLEKDLIQELILFMQKQRILSSLPCDVTDFINSRFILYSEEFTVIVDELREEPVVPIPVRTAYNFFDTPLKLESGKCLDPFRIIQMQQKLKHFFDVLNKSLEVTIKEIGL